MSPKREDYLKDRDISAVAHTQLEAVCRASGRAFPAIPEGPQALLVIDAQRFFLDPLSPAALPVAQAVTPRLGEAVHRAARAGISVAATRHAHRADSDPFPFLSIWHKRLLESDPLAALHPALESVLTPLAAPVFTKDTYSAFEGTDLCEWLRERAVRVLLLAGVTSHLCVETTARHALCLGFFPVVLADACAAWTETQHVRLLAAMADGVGGATTLEELWP